MALAEKGFSALCSVGCGSDNDEVGDTGGGNRVKACDEEVIEAVEDESNVDGFAMADEGTSAISRGDKVCDEAEAIETVEGVAVNGKSNVDDVAMAVEGTSALFSGDNGALRGVEKVAAAPVVSNGISTVVRALGPDVNGEETIVVGDIVGYS